MGVHQYFGTNYIFDVKWNVKACITAVHRYVYLKHERWLLQNFFIGAILCCEYEYFS